MPSIDVLSIPKVRCRNCGEEADVRPTGIGYSRARGGLIVTTYQPPNGFTKVRSADMPVWEYEHTTPCTE